MGGSSFFLLEWFDLFYIWSDSELITMLVLGSYDTSNLGFFLGLVSISYGVFLILGGLIFGYFFSGLPNLIFW